MIEMQNQASSNDTGYYYGYHSDHISHFTSHIKLRVSVRQLSLPYPDERGR